MAETLVTGATGFVGYHLVSALCARGDNVRILALPEEDTSRLEQLHTHIYQGNVTQPETLVEPVRGVDTIFHLAAIHGLWRPRQDYYSVNVSGVENVCQAALSAGVRRLIHVSSWTVYGMGLSRVVDEEFPLRPIADLYTETKAEGERLVQRYIARDHLPAVTVRPGTMFGPGDHVNFGRMADRLRNGTALIIGSGHNALPFVYVTNVVEGMLLAANQERAVGQVYNLGDDQPLTQSEFWQAIAEAIRTKPPRVRLPYWLLYTLAFFAEHANKFASGGRQPLLTRLGVKLFGTDNRHAIDKARRELGYIPRVSIREGLNRASEWYLRQQAPTSPVRTESK